MWMEVRIGLLRGLGFSCACAGFIGTVLFAQSMTSFQAGDLVSASTLNANFTALQTKVTEASPDGAVAQCVKKFKNRCNFQITIFSNKFQF